MSAAGAGAGAADRRDPADVVRDAILPALAFHALVFGFGLLALVIFRPAVLDEGWLQVWNRWDAPHFLEVAANGYGPPTDPARIVLFPALPALIAIGSVVMTPLAAGMVVSLLATLAAAAGVYRLAALDGSRTIARAAVVAMLVYPTAFTLIAPYSEPLFIAAVAWSFVRARQDDWRSAGFLALIAGATRIQGAFLAPALALEYFLRRRHVERDAGWLLLSLGGPLIYLAINVATFGDPFYFVHVQAQVFQVSNVAPWSVAATLLNGLQHAPLNESWLTVYLAPAVAFVALGLVAVWSLFGRASRPSYAAFVLLNLASLATLSWPISVPRYLFGIVPVFLAGAQTAHRPWLAITLLVGSTLLMAVVTTLFVMGHWAF